MCVMMSAALVMRVARWSRMRAWQPADMAGVTGPGAAISGRPRSLACLAVARVPLRAAASTTIVPAQARAAISRYGRGS
jgi:hypothetical protein